MTNRKIMEIADMLEGEINRMCVTQDVKELKSMMKYAWGNIFEIYELRLAKLRGEENSVLIKDFKIPESCYECMFNSEADGECYVNECKCEWGHSRPAECPLIELNTMGECYKK